MGSLCARVRRLGTQDFNNGEALQGLDVKLLLLSTLFCAAVDMSNTICFNLVDSCPPHYLGRIWQVGDDAMS
jgi:hypothetical protein